MHSFRYLDEFSERDYARSGDIASETIELQEGQLEYIAGSMEPYLRKLGLPVKLDNGSFNYFAILKEVALSIETSFQARKYDLNLFNNLSIMH